MLSRRAVRPTAAGAERTEDRGRRGRVLAKVAMLGLSALALMTLLAPTVGSQSSDGESSGGDWSFADDPVVQERIEREQARVAEREEYLASPEARAVRDRSATAHADASDAEALEIARGEFGEILEEPLWPGLELEEGDRIAEFLGDFAARVETGTGRAGLLLESSLPLRARTEAGAMRLLETELVDLGEKVAPANPLVETTIPDELSRRIVFEREGFSVRPAGAPVPRLPIVERDKVFYPNINQDTDFFVGPLPTGVETFLQLRSARSPELHALDFDLAAGQQLRLVPGGAGEAEIVTDGETVAHIAAPVAWDSQGQAVPVTYAVEGDRLLLRVPHAGGDYAYPLLVDPVIESYDWTKTMKPGAYPGDTDGWFVGTNAAAKFEETFYYGLRTNSLPDTYYQDDHYSQWLLQAPRESFIERVDFHHYDRASNGESACTLQGIYNLANFRWEQGTLKHGKTGVIERDAIPKVRCGDFEELREHYFWVGDSATPDGPGGDAEGANRNIAVFQLRMYGAGRRARTTRQRAQGVTVYLHDRNDPTFTSAAPVTRDWTDDSGPDGPRTYAVEPAADDPGLGMKAFNFVGPGVDDSGDGSPGVATRIHPCTGDRRYRCPVSWSADFDYRLQEGRNELALVAHDVIARHSNQRWTQLIDRSDPALELSGSLYDETEARPYRLTVDGRDGNRSSPSSERSGVASIEVLVDGRRELFERQDCAEGSCPMSRTLELDPLEYPEGEHRFKVIVTDHVGRESVEQFTRRLDYAGPRIVRVESSHAERKISRTRLESVWLDDEQIETQLFAEDPGGGITAFELELPDGRTLRHDRNCGGDCPAYTGETFNYRSGAMPEGIHEGEGRAFDRRGGAGEEQIPFKIDHTNPTHDRERFEQSPLYLTRDALIYGLNYPLEISGFDRSDQGPRAGVHAIEVLVDGERRARWTQACPAGSCPMERTFLFDTTEYEADDDPTTDDTHEVEARIVDAAGNTFSRSFEVRITEELGEPRPESARFGLEQYFHYDSTETGVSGAHANLGTGNVVWHKTPLVNPGRGLSSFLNVTYNSFDYPEVALPAAADTHFGGVEYDEAGNGVSLAISGITRINEPLGGLADAEDGGSPAVVTITDADGTQHPFTLIGADPSDPQSDHLFEYRAPPGVNLRLRQYSNVLTDALGTKLLPEQREKAWALTRPDGVTQFFDGYGFLRSIEDRNGNVMTFEYDYVTVETGEKCLVQVVVPGVCEPRLARVVDAAGSEAPAGSGLRDQRAIKIDYYPILAAPLAGSAGKIRRITDHGGRSMRFSYDDEGFLTSLTEAEGTPAERTTRLAYDDPGATEPHKHPQLSRVVDPRGGATTFSYYEDTALADLPSRRVFQVTNRRGATRTFSYGGDQQDHSESTTAEVTDGRGGSWEYALDLRDRPLDITDPLGTRTHLEWDSDNNVIGMTEAAGSEDEATTDYAYNQNGLLTSQTDPLGRTTYLRYRDTAGMHRSQYTSVESTLEQSIDTDADAFVSDLVAIRRPAGNEWTFELEPDAATDGTATTNGNVTAEIDPLGNRTEATYNPNGTLSSETDAVGNTATYIDYDPNGMPQVVVDPRGNSGEEPASEHRWLYRYDAVGNTTHVTDPRGTAGYVAGGSIPPTFTTTLTYDALDRLTRERIPKDSRDGEFVTRSYEYDANDNQTARVDGEAERWTSTYTAMDRIASESTPLSERTTYAYDAEEGLTEVVAPRGTATAVDGDHVTRFRLDAIGRRLATIRESTEDEPLITSYAYDRRDNVAGVAYPRNNTTALGQSASVSEALANASQPGSQRVAMTYDDANQLVAQVEDPGGLALRTEHRYDQNGNLREVLSPRGFAEGPDPAAFAQITDYDARDLPIAETDELGNRTEYERREDGLVVEETRPNGAATALPGDYTVRYEYDANGQLASRSLPWREGQYGLSNDPDGKPTLGTVSYRRNAVGDPVEVTDARGYEVRNTFLDTGQLASTTRPSWWQLDWGAGQPTPDPAERYSQSGSDATEPDVMVSAGGPQLVERPRPESGGATNDGSAGSELTPGGSGSTDFGDVQPEEIGDMLPAAGRTRFDYDDELRMTAVTPEEIPGAPAAVPFEIAYDAAGRVSQKLWPVDPYADEGPATGAFQPTPRFIRHSFGYDRNGNLTSFTNGQGNLPSESPAPHTTRFSYDQFDRRIAEAAPGSKDVSDPELNKEVTNLAYDPNGNVLRRETARGSTTPDPDDFTFRFGYDSVDRLISEANPLRDTWTYSYDAASNRVSETSPRGTETVADGDFTTTTAYDPANRPIRVAEPEDRVTEMTYDRNGNLTRVVEPGAATSLGADMSPGAVADHVTAYTYDGRDLLWRETVGEGDYRRTTITEYDPNGNLRRIVNPRGVSDGGDPVAIDDGTGRWANAEHATVNEFSPHDQLVATQLPWGSEGSTSDANGINQQAENEEHVRQERDYDDRGRLTAVSNPFEEGSGERRFTTYSHYDNGWVRSSSDPTLTDPGNPDRQVYDQTIDYSYDARGNQTLWHSRGFSEGRSEGRKIQREFWPSGLLRERTGLKPVEGADDVARRSYSYAYNENRSLTQVTDRLPQGSPVDQAVRETRIVRDGAEREAAVDEQWASGRDTAFSYDADGNVSERRTDGDYSGGSYAGGKTTAFSFDALGRETRMEVTGSGDARTVETDYYPSSAIAERRRWVEGNSAVTEAYAYRSDGLIAEMMRSGGAGNSKDQSYAYDQNGNRTRDERGEHTFNARDQLVLWERGEGQPKPGTFVSYVLNGSGAIERELDDGEQTTYRYNGERLLSAEDEETRSTYFYDDFGNVRRISTQSRLDNGVFPDAPAPPSPGYACEQEIEGWTEASDTYYCYDEFERLGASQGPGQDGESYVHDGLDRRDLKLTRDGGARISEYSYVGTSESLAREQRPDGGAADYDYSATGERMGQRMRDSGTDEFHPYAKDANGSVEALEQDDGSIAEADRYRYDPYGELEDPNEDNDQDADEELGTDAESNPFRFQGHYYDSAIKTYDMQAREYRPDVGRFLSADRFEAAGMDLALQSDPLTQNRYAFAGGNPVSRIEFDGHIGWEMAHVYDEKGAKGQRRYRKRNYGYGSSYHEHTGTYLGSGTKAAESAPPATYASKAAKRVFTEPPTVRPVSPPPQIAARMTARALEIDVRTAEGQKDYEEWWSEQRLDQGWLSEALYGELNRAGEPYCPANRISVECGNLMENGGAARGVVTALQKLGRLVIRRPGAQAVPTLSGTGARTGAQRTITALTREQDTAFQSVMRDPNRLDHIFGQGGKHNLGRLTQELGGKEAVVREAILRVPLSRAEGVFKLSDRIGPHPVTITGRMMNGVPRISNIWAPR